MIKTLNEYEEKDHDWDQCSECKKYIKQSSLDPGTFQSLSDGESYVELIFLHKNGNTYPYLFCLECWSAIAGEEFTLETFESRNVGKKTG